MGPRPSAGPHAPHPIPLDSTTETTRMLALLSHPWPWYVTGPLIGTVAVALLLYGGRMLGVSASYRAICAAVAPGRVEFFRFDWRSAGGWNLAFACGLALGGF